MMKVVTIVGARPQFIKAAVVSRVIRDDYSDKIQEVLIHTGQHYDDNMSKVFFEELDIPKPKYNLEISGGHHGEMTGRMLEAIERVLLEEKPDWVLIYGDTNSTLAGALAAAKLHIPVAHVEAGLRSFNMLMPEEINRILTDRVSSLLICPSETAIKNLSDEGISAGVYNFGDVMYDVALYYKKQANQQSKILESLNLNKANFVLATCHRAENTDESSRLEQILKALSEISSVIQVVLPIHPRTKKLIYTFGLSTFLDNLTVTEPLAFLDMISLEQSAKIICTDSGGVQKEAFFYHVPCITMREETEWVETVNFGANILTGANTQAILDAYERYKDFDSSSLKLDSFKPYGDGTAAHKIVRLMESIL
jgi:UDP-GlcNAc3NAcA epimerase